MVFKCDRIAGILAAMSETKRGRPPVENPLKKEKVDLRLPEGMRERLQACADRDGRSMNQQIVHYVEAGLEGMDGKSLAKAVLEICQMLADLKGKG